MAKIVKKLICFDSASLDWLKAHENASLAIRKLIHAELCKAKLGRPHAKKSISLLCVGDSGRKQAEMGVF